MAKAFHLFKLKRFPNSQRFGTEDQLYLTMDGASNRESVHTTVERTNGSVRPNVTRYVVSHDYLTKLRRPARAVGHQFSEFVSEHRFPVYVDSSDSEAPTLIAVTKGDIAKDFIRRLVKKNSEAFLALERQVDFDQLQPRLGVIVGAWFRDMQVANLSAAGMFGQHVDRSDEFIRAQRHGRLRCLTSPYRYQGAHYRIQISESGGVVVFDSFDSDEEALDLVLDVKHRVLDGCWLM